MSDNNDQTLPFEQPIPVGIEEEMKRSYLDYAMRVIGCRARPGLKPAYPWVHHGMWGEGEAAECREG